jgi:hypothetical protein
MELIFHIGMGKTGTSSIQQALKADKENLEAQGAAYLGMWLDMLDPEFKQHGGFNTFFSATPDTMVFYADKFVEHALGVASQTGCQKLIFSNEALFDHEEPLAHFFTRLREHADLKIVAYLRNPYDWLPSAFTQWGLRHKTTPGVVPPYQQRARSLIRRYESVRLWERDFGDILDVRLFDKSIDVVEDFSGMLDLSVTPLPKRALEREESVEVLLRGLYNSRYRQPISPERFNGFVLNAARNRPQSVSASFAEWFDWSDTTEVVAEHRDLFEHVSDKYGFDFVTPPTQSKSVELDEEFRDRLVDYLLAITFEQADRLKRLELQVKALNPDED